MRGRVLHPVKLRIALTVSTCFATGRSLHDKQIIPKRLGFEAYD